MGPQSFLKFGPLPGWVKVRLADADEATLGRWVAQVLDANALKTSLLNAQRIEDVRFPEYYPVYRGLIQVNQDDMRYFHGRHSALNRLK